MKKYTYKMVMKNNDDLWKANGAFKRVPVGVGFANKLGEEGFEMFQVVQYATNSAYFFKKEIS